MRNELLKGLCRLVVLGLAAYFFCRAIAHNCLYSSAIAVALVATWLIWTIVSIKNKNS